MARLEMRRRYALNIFQSIEYAEEQAQLQLSDFFTFMLDHFTQLNETDTDSVSHFFDGISDFNTTSSDLVLLEYEKMIEVPHSYRGPRLSFPLTAEDTAALLHAFKYHQQLHARYVLQLLHETRRVLRQMPNITHLSTSYSKEITICGDLHGKLDDLLLIFYKNGVPSEKNPYLFNGDFVDRGKNSMEILIILFAFLLVYPNDLHLNRGNHEDYLINLRYGFTKEVMKKYRYHGQKILRLLEDVFSWLPLATIIDSKVLILHGGISDTTDLDLLNLFSRNKMKSVLKPPNPHTQKKSSLNKTGLVEQHSSVSKRTAKSPATSGYRGPHTNDRSDAEERTRRLHGGTRSDLPPQMHYLESSACKLPELTAKEWKQVVDILWSDPKTQKGCTSNKYRGAGCYFGPDVTSRLLKKYNLKMLIRSHECKQEGYEVIHGGKVITIFSASNYYEEGSNRGAYIKLNPNLIPRFVQYQVSKHTRKETLNQRVSVVECSALKSLREKIYTHRLELIETFKQYDPNDTGYISVGEWALAMESVLHLDLPWRTLRSRLVQLGSDERVDYLSCFDDLEIEQPLKEVKRKRFSSVACQLCGF